MCVCVYIYICTLCIHTHVHVYLLCIAYVRELEPPTFRGPENSPLHAVSCAYVQHQLCIRTHASHTHIHHDAHTHVRWEKHAKSALGGILPWSQHNIRLHKHKTLRPEHDNIERCRLHLRSCDQLITNDRHCGYSGHADHRYQM